jgi:hypothetical protein
MKNPLICTNATGLLCGIIFLLSLPAFAGQTYFEDEFLGTALDSSLWNTDHATGGIRWCQSTVKGSPIEPARWFFSETEYCHNHRQYPPFGSIKVDGGGASFYAGSNAAFPYIWAGEPSRPSPFPEKGDFILEIRMRFDAFTGHGNGIHVADWEKNSDPVGDNQPSKTALIIWGDHGNYIGMPGGGGRYFFPDRYGFHVYRLEYIDGYYTLYRDDALLLGPVKSTVRPDTIRIGNPIYTFWLVMDWTDFTIDYIRVTVPQIDVPVDIKPQSCPNPLNVKSKGVLPVTVPGTEELDVTQIDPASVTLAGIPALRYFIEDVATPYEPYTGKSSVFDCNADGVDGYTDLTLKFDRQAVLDAIGAVSDGESIILELTGEMYDRTPIKGEDVVLIRKKTNN